MTDFFEMQFPADHPTAAGHFPGNPIIPGALLLDIVAHTIAGDAPSQGCAVRSAKFLTPVRPGDRIRIEWEKKGDETQFRCLLTPSGTTALTGTLRFDVKTA